MYYYGLLGMEYSGPSSLKGREQAPSPATVIISSPGQAAFASPQISMLVCAGKITCVYVTGPEE